MALSEMARDTQEFAWRKLGLLLGWCGEEKVGEQTALIELKSPPPPPIQGTTH